MTNSFYLILHKVRGEPALDIAVKLNAETEDNSGYGIEEIFIIPTSGHRAYPYWVFPLIMELRMLFSRDACLSLLPEMPADLPDHYSTTREPAKTTVIGSLLQHLGLSKPIDRRI